MTEKGGADGSGVKLSVVMACLNEEEMIGHQLEALSSQHWTEPWEVIVADNGSTDQTLEVVEGYRHRLPALKVVDASDRKGQPHALNRGVEAARAEAVAFCDADDEVAEGWVEAMGEALQEHEFVAGPFKGQKLNSPLMQTVRNTGQENGLQTQYPLPAAGSGNMGIRRSIFEAVGGFDNTIPGIFDVDFCWRVQRQTGAELVFVPEAVLHVRYRDTLLGMYRQAHKWSSAKVELYRRYGLTSMETDPPSWFEIKHKIRQLIDKALAIRSKADLYRWMWDLGWQVGHLEARRKKPHGQPKREPLVPTEEDQVSRET